MCRDYEIIGDCMDELREEMEKEFINAVNWEFTQAFELPVEVNIEDL